MLSRPPQLTLPRMEAILDNLLLNFFHRVAATSRAGGVYQVFLGHALSVYSRKPCDTSASSLPILALRPTE